MESALKFEPAFARSLLRVTAACAFRAFDAQGPQLTIMCNKSSLVHLCLTWLTCCFAVMATASSPSAAQLLDNMHFQRLLTGEAEKSGVGTVFSIVQDEVGYIWIGGNSGLARYDSHRFKFYHADRAKAGALVSSWISDLEIDQDGAMWVATSDGLSRYNALTDDFTTYRSGSDIAVGHDLIHALAVDKYNNLYIGTGGGLSVMNAERSSIKHYRHDPNNPESLAADTVTEVFADRDGRLWIGYGGSGISRFNPETGTFVHWRHDPQDPKSLGHDNVQRIKQDASGRLWIGSDSGGLFRMEPDGKSFRNYRHDPSEPGSIGSNVIGDIHADRRGNLWIATDHGGLALYDEKNDAFLHLRHHVYDRTTLVSDQLRTIYEDRLGNLWIGTAPTGVSFYDISKARFRSLTHNPDNSNSLSHNVALCITADSEGLLWIGTENGLNSYDRRTGKITRYYPNPDDPTALMFGAVTSVTEDIDGKLWVGTWSGGLHLFDKKTQKFKRYFPEPDNPSSLVGHHVWDVARDADNTIWIGTIRQGGMSQYVRESDDFIHYRHDPNDPDSLTLNYVWKILPDSRGNLWVGTLNGLDRFDKESKKFTHFRHVPGDPHSLSNNAIFTIKEDSTGLIWIGTVGGGLNLFDPNTGKFGKIGVAQGLPSDHIATIIEDKQSNIWVGTSAGLAMVDRDTFIIKILRQADGLVGNTTTRNASFVAENGDIYIGSTEGISIFNPDDLDQFLPPPRIVITGFRIFNKEVPIGTPGSPLRQAIGRTRQLTLSYKDTMFAFDFAALNFNSSSQNAYSYKLEGFDQSWHEVEGIRTATYTNLDPGHYTFRVRGRTGTGAWSEEDAHIDITVTPPFWRTGWAYTGYCLLLLLAIYTRRRHVALRRHVDHYRTLSATDPLTGIMNRAGILQVANRVMADPLEQCALTLMLLDIDHFKRINDVRGHDAGDRVLKSFVDVIKQNIRAQDTIARWGGEEFVLVCRHSPPEAANVIAQKLRRAVAEHDFKEGSAGLRVTVSVGVATLRPGESFDELLKRADVALYQAKSAGRNSVAASD